MSAWVRPRTPGTAPPLAVALLEVAATLVVVTLVAVSPPTVDAVLSSATPSAKAQASETAALSTDTAAPLLTTAVDRTVAVTPAVVTLVVVSPRMASADLPTVVPPAPTLASETVARSTDGAVLLLATADRCG